MAPGGHSQLIKYPTKFHDIEYLGNISDEIRNEIQTEVEKGARSLVISWDAVDRNWVRSYFKVKNPKPVKLKLEPEVFRVDLTINPVDFSHVHLDEEP